MRNRVSRQTEALHPRMQGLFFLIFVVGLRYDASGLTGEVYDGAFLIQPPITTRYVIMMTGTRNVSTPRNFHFTSDASPRTR